MTPKIAMIWLEFIIALEFLLLVFVIGLVVISAVYHSLYPSPEVIYYFQNCNNLTLFPDGCQVLS